MSQNDDMEPIVMIEGEPVAGASSAADTLPIASDDGQAKCLGTTRYGKPCTNQSLKTSDYCYHHEPKSAEKLGESLAKATNGSLKRKPYAGTPFMPKRFETPHDILQVVHGVIVALIRDTLPAKRCTAIFYGCNAAFRGIESMKPKVREATLRVEFGKDNQIRKAEIEIKGALDEIRAIVGSKAG